MSRRDELTYVGLNLTGDDTVELMLATPNGRIRSAELNRTELLAIIQRAARVLDGLDRRAVERARRAGRETG